jgi:hypothetical protein
MRQSSKGFTRGPVAGIYLHLFGRTGDVEENNPYVTTIVWNIPPHVKENRELAEGLEAG